MDDVQVRQRRLDHDHVGAFGQVEADFADCFATIGRVHLIPASVAELGRRISGLTKWPVERAGVLGGIGQDGRIN